MKKVIIAKLGGLWNIKYISFYFVNLIVQINVFHIKYWAVGVDYFPL